MDALLVAQQAALGLPDVEQLVNSLVTTAQVKGPQLAASILTAGAIFLLGSWSARIAVRVLEKVLERARLDETLAKFVCRLAHSLLLVVVTLSGLEQLGINTTSVAAIMAAAGLAVGMALQGSLSNFAAGVMMIIFRPFKVGDTIEAGGAKGIVEEIHVFNTLLRTADNVQVIVPNSAVTASNITNYSRKPTRRIDLVISCSYKDDLRAVKQFLNELLASDPRVLKKPEPVVAVAQLSAHSVDFNVMPWVASRDYGAVRSDLIERIKIGFDANGFEIPFPQQDVHVRSPAASAVPPSRPSAPVLNVPEPAVRVAEEPAPPRPRGFMALRRAA